MPKMYSSLSIVSTQMQFINCVEYLQKYQILHNDIVFFAVSETRKKQLKDIYCIECNKKIFRNVWFVTLSPKRIPTLFSTFVLLLKLFLVTKISDYNVCILGNYRNCFGRYVWARKSTITKVAVDDGLATLSWYNDRKNEIAKNEANIFYNNRLLKILLRKRINDAIPESVVFFTIHRGNPFLMDRIIFNKYTFILSHSSFYPNSEVFKSSTVVFLGQPLYLHGELTEKRYNEYLRMTYNSFAQGKAIYYPHPDELSSDWMEIDIKEKFRVIPNCFSFEIYSKILPENCIVISFQTSTFSVLQHISPNIKLVSIFINEMETKDDELSKTWIKGYNYLKESGVQVVKFS